MGGHHTFVVAVRVALNDVASVSSTQISPLESLLLMLKLLLRLDPILLTFKRVECSCFMLAWLARVSRAPVKGLCGDLLENVYGVSQSWGYMCVGPQNKDNDILGSILGSPCFGKLAKGGYNITQGIGYAGLCLQSLSSTLYSLEVNHVDGNSTALISVALELGWVKANPCPCAPTGVNVIAHCCQRDCSL